MKKQMVVWIVLLSLLLSACGGRPTQQPDEPQPSAPEEVQPEIPQEQPEEKPQEQPEEKPQEQPEEKPQEQPETPKPHILDQRQPVAEQASLWHIPHEEIAGSLQQQMCMFRDTLLVWGTAMEQDRAVFRLTRYSLETGEILHRISLPQADIPQVQVCGNVLAVSDWGKGTVVLLNDTLQQTDTLHAEVTYGGVFLSPDGNTLYSLNRENGILAENRVTGEKTVLLEEAVGLLAGGRCGRWVTVSYTDRNSQLSQIRVLDLQTGTLEEAPFPGGFTTVSRCGDLWLASVLGEEHTWYLGLAERPYRFQTEGTFALASLLEHGPMLLLTSYDAAGSTVMRLYHGNGQFLSQCALPAGAVQASELVWSQEDNGYYFLVTDESGADQLLFWDTAKPMVGDNLQLQPAYLPPEAGSVVSEALYEKADQLSEQYGIEIKIAELAGTEFRSFTANPETDEDYIRRALETVEQTLVLYPEGFFAQLHHGMNQRIELHLTGALHRLEQPEAATGFTSFSGFMEEGEGGSVVAVDITGAGSLQQTLCHEIAHLIDSRLAFDAKLREEALYDLTEWESLNPVDFSYAETYVDLPMSFYTDGYDSWFVDLYSRTFAKEDRARILEYATVGMPQVFARAPGCREKLEYLCACIRDTFDTAGWSELTAWELTLQQVS